ncbi:hypothetical protein GCM10020000_05890 [Streptomyces olivoverticillatus]
MVGSAGDAGAGEGADERPGAQRGLQQGDGAAAVAQHRFGVQRDDHEDRGGEEVGGGEADEDPADVGKPREDAAQRAPTFRFAGAFGRGLGRGAEAHGGDEGRGEGVGGGAAGREPGHSGPVDDQGAEQCPAEARQRLGGEFEAGRGLDVLVVDEFGYGGGQAGVEERLAGGERERRGVGGGEWQSAGVRPCGQRRGGRARGGGRRAQQGAVGEAGDGAGDDGGQCHGGQGADGHEQAGGEPAAAGHGVGDQPPGDADLEHAHGGLGEDLAEPYGAEGAVAQDERQPPCGVRGGDGGAVMRWASRR